LGDNQRPPCKPSTHNKNGQCSIILRVKLYDSSVTTQAGKTAMKFNRPASSSPRSPTMRRCGTYTQAAGKIEAISVDRRQYFSVIVFP
jgi:hypothetical protein